MHRLVPITLVVILVSGCHLKTLDAPSSYVTTGGSVVGSSGGSGSGGSTPLAPLSLASISPSQGSFVSGEVVTFTGTGFTARTRIQIDGVTCATVGIDSTTSAWCAVPPHALGSVTLTLFNYDNPTDTFTRMFTYITDGYANDTSPIGDDSNNAYAEGVGNAAQFAGIEGIALSGRTLYISDAGNNVVRQVDMTTYTSTKLAGTPMTAADGSSTATDDGTTDTALFDDPTALAAVGTLVFVIDGSGIRKIDTVAKTVTTVLGNRLLPGAVNATGTAARFSSPTGLATDGNNLYVSDTGNNMIRKVSLADFSVTTLAGQRTAGYADNTGVLAHFNTPNGITYMNGKVYVADYGNDAIRVVDTTTGAVTTLAGGVGSGDVDGTGSRVRLENLSSITNDGTDLYITDGVAYIIRRVVVATGEVRLLAGTPGTLAGDNVSGPIQSTPLPIGTGLAWGPNDGLLLSGGLSVKQIK